MKQERHFLIPENNKETEVDSSKETQIDNQLPASDDQTPRIDDEDMSHSNSNSNQNANVSKKEPEKSTNKLQDVKSIVYTNEIITSNGS